ncbi:acyltransferase family protein [Terriglobus aquaticus]|uniref:Acyltransferase family protein n=1 Tax=Terriglobus aquaticus TaxID=940139 RepID=A0ABW9KR62_9BACT|nr:acyltransferase [Terriglobus aquaticus]
MSKNYLSFNGIRALALLLVFYRHYGPIAYPERFHSSLAFGGVDLFFVLSGFLITGILYKSAHRQDYFSRFYLRRALRTLPLYFGVFAVLYLYLLVSHTDAPKGMWMNLFFIQTMPMHMYSAGTTDLTPFDIHLRSGGVIGLGVLWSMAVEQNFYLLWPFVIRFLRDRKKLLALSGAGVVFEVVLRCILFHVDSNVAGKSDYMYFFPLTHCDGLFVGAFLNLWLQEAKLTRRQLHLSGVGLLAVGIVGYAVGQSLFGHGMWNYELNPMVQTFSSSLLALRGGGLLLLSLDHESWVSRALQWRPLQELGLVSYGFYMIHYLRKDLVSQMADHMPGHTRLLTLPIVFGFSFAFAWVSFHFYEKRFTTWKPGKITVDHAAQLAPEPAGVLV